MAKYKVGDKVRVRSDLKRYDSTGKIKQYCMENDKTEHNTVVDDMPNFAGKIVKIIKVGSQYSIEGNKWSWTDEMFEGFAEEPKFNVYDTVKHIIYGIGTIIKTDKLSSGKEIYKIEFDEWNEDFPNFNENVIWILPNDLTLIKAYSPN
jgi:hypothetical protein